jgi:ankyrin repeat protein
MGILYIISENIFQKKYSNFYFYLNLLFFSTFFASHTSFCSSDNIRDDTDSNNIGSTLVTDASGACTHSTVTYPLSSPEHTDYMRFLNVRYLVKNKDNYHPIFLLRNLSWQIDGMQVLKRSFRDRTTLIVPIWSLLAYLHKGLNISELSPDFKGAFVAKFLPFVDELPQILVDLENLEAKKSNLHKMMREKPKKIARNAFILNTKRQVEQEGKTYSSDDEFLSSIANNPIDDELKAIQKCSLFTHEYRFQKSLTRVGEYLQDCSMDITPIEKLRQKVEVEEKQISGLLKNINKSSNIQKIRRLIGTLYEYDSLKKAQEALTYLEKLNVNANAFINTHDRHILFQIFTVLGESLNNINTPLDIEREKDILKFIPPLKYIRNIFEHLEGYKYDKYNNLLHNNDFSIKIWKGITQDLLALKTPLELRISKLKELFTSEENCDEKLNILLENGELNTKEDGTSPGNTPKKPSLLLQQSHWKNNGLPYVQWLRRYFYHPTYDLIDPESEVLEETAKTIVKNEGKKDYRKPKETEKIIDIDEIIDDIKKITQITQNFPTRSQFIKKLNKDLGLRYALLHLANQIHFKLNRNIEGHHLAFYNQLNPKNKILFEIIFKDMKNRRNYSVHDLWRNDIRGLGTLLHIHLNRLQFILYSTTPTSSVIVSDATRQMWKKISEGKISSKKLRNLIAAGADVNALDKRGDSPLMCIIDFGKNKLVDILLEKGADPNLCDRKSIYPIHIAAQDGRIDLIQVLVDAGADPDPKDIDGLTPENYAIDNGHEDCAAFLRSMCARYRGDKADKLHQNLDPMWFDKKMIDSVMGRSPNLFNADGELPLIIAIKKSQADNQAEILQVMRTLVEAGAEINKQQSIDKRTTLIAAAQYSRDDALLLYLLQTRADVETVDKFGWSALHYAVEQGNNSFIRILLDNGASLSVKDENGITPLLVELNKRGGGNINTVKLLLEKGADINDRNHRTNMSSLDYINSNRRKDILKLLENFTNINPTTTS